jgi:hypothetical protein
MAADRPDYGSYACKLATINYLKIYIKQSLKDDGNNSTDKLIGIQTNLKL